MSSRAFFATLVYEAALQRRGAAQFNRQLLREIAILCRDDKAGRKWSSRSYPGGYTSYASLSRLQNISPSFAVLEHKLAPHVAAYVKALGLDLDGRTLAMTDCWVNVMPKGVSHGQHLHPMSTLSGTYYVQTPRTASGLKIEDPRLDRFMAAPPRRDRQRGGAQAWVTLPAKAGCLIMFESWLRHEVPPNPSSAERVSISFNFNWF